MAGRRVGARREGDAWRNGKDLFIGSFTCGLPCPPAQQLPSLPSRRRCAYFVPLDGCAGHDWLLLTHCRAVPAVSSRPFPSPLHSILFARLHLQTQSRGSHHDEVTSSQFHPEQRLKILPEEDGSHTARMGTTGEAQRRRRDEHTLPAPNPGHDRRRQSFKPSHIDLLSRTKQRWVPIPADRSILGLTRAD